MPAKIILVQRVDLVGAIGSLGGLSVLAHNAKMLIAGLIWGLPLQQAFNLPDLRVLGDGFGGGAERFTPALRDGMTAAAFTFNGSHPRSHICTVAQGLREMEPGVGTAGLTIAVSTKSRPIDRS